MRQGSRKRDGVSAREKRNYSKCTANHYAGGTLVTPEPIAAGYTDAISRVTDDLSKKSVYSFYAWISLEGGGEPLTT